MKEKDLWMEKLKEKLGEYTEPMPASGWERLEKELMPPSEKRIIPYRRWVAAASILLVLATSVSLYFLQTPVADEIRRTSVPMLATTTPDVPDAMPLKQEPVWQVAQVEPMRRASTARMMREQLPLMNDDKAVNDDKTVDDDDKETTVDNHKEVTTTTDDVAVTEPITEGKVVRKPSGRDKLQLPQSSESTSKGRWSMGASISNAGAISGGAVAYEGGQPRNSHRLDMAAAPNGVVPIPSDQMLVFKEGIPYLQSANEITDIKHHQPISFGLSVRRELPKGFSIETGLTYTLLSSDVQLSGGNAMEDQKLHYIGIPLRANWNMVDQKLFTLYLSAGGAVEKCVYGELANEKVSVNPLQLSVMGAVGAQFNATKRLGIYIEPGIAYFFNDGSHMRTIRKDTPLNFNLQAGVRFTY